MGVTAHQGKRLSTVSMTLPRSGVAAVRGVLLASLLPVVIACSAPSPGGGIPAAPAIGEDAWSLAGLEPLGDVDGDGREDCAAWILPSAVRLGLEEGLLLALSGSDGRVIWRRDGESPAMEWRGFLDGSADFTSDGVRDLVAGCPRKEVRGMEGGTVRILSGRSGAVLLTVVPGDGAAEFGREGSALGDIDGDGTPDLALRSPAPVDSPREGLADVRLHSGRTGAFLSSIREPGWSAVRSCRLGDSDGDGIPDLAVAWSRPGAAGRGWESLVTLVSSASGRAISRIPGTAAGGNLGRRMDPIPDIDGDGVSDLLILEPGGDPDSTGDTGPAVTTSGRFPRGRLAAHSGMSGALLWERSGEVPTLEGWTDLALAGDADGDGIPDPWVGSPGSGRFPLDPEPAGAAFLLSGRTGRVLRRVDGPPGILRFGERMAPLEGEGGLLLLSGHVMEDSGRRTWRILAMDREAGVTFQVDPTVLAR
ncbi:MAG: VCBS repeat-containing protein [Planctomycetaceae bacterium]|nr:VCBS repeat-containing protein [Planctomycetota bacterium]NUN52212.1 VCBS repeat-containing protein [Planctomycetaceae bacterium]